MKGLRQQIALAALCAAAIVTHADIVMLDDVNRDGATNVGDINTVLTTILAGEYDTTCDVNRDGEVNVGDVNNVLGTILTGNHIEYRTEYDYVWDEGQMAEVHLEVAVDEWNKLLLAYDADKLTKLYIAADMDFVQRGQTLHIDNIGMRIRGNGSRHRPEGKPGELHTTDSTTWHSVGWGLNFRKYVKDDEHTLRGIRKIWLRYGYNEPTHMREHFGYTMYRDYGVWTAPRSTFCRVWIHVTGDAKPAYYGVDNILEPIDDRYVKDRSALFGGHKGYLWKCGKGEADLRRNADDMFGWDDNGAMDEKVYVLKTETEQFDNAKVQMQAFIDSINVPDNNRFHDWIARVTDVELLLKTYAGMVALGNWDDYWNNSNNYYLYFNSTDPVRYKVFFIPYDLDNTLGCSRRVGNIVDIGRQDPMNWGLGDVNPLIARMLTHDDYRNIYIRSLKQLVDPELHLMDPESATARCAAWFQMLKPYFPADMDRDNRLYDGPNELSNIKNYRLTYDTPSNYFTVKKQVIDALPDPE